MYIIFSIGFSSVIRAESVAAPFLPWTENSTLAEVKRRGYLTTWPKGTGTFGVPRSNFSCPGSLLFSLTQFLGIFSSYDVKSAVGLFVVLWTAACQAPLSMGILQARILKWVAMPFSRESSWFRNLIGVSCTGRRVLYRWVTREAQNEHIHPFYSIYLYIWLSKR